MATPNRNGPKIMSSRLATMKFMQRASASPASNPSTPVEPSSKRQRLSNGSANPSPPPVPRFDSESQAVLDAKAREEQVHKTFVEREGLEKGDTKWYLSVQQAPKPTAESPLRIVSTGYAALDEGREVQDESEEEQEQEQVEGEVQGTGRMNFGNFTRKPVAVKNEFASSGSDSSASESEDYEDDPTGVKALIRQQEKEAGARVRAERKQQRKLDAAESARLAATRRKKDVDLNRVTSISGSGKPSAPPSSMECFTCGKKGHKKSECPQQQRRKGGDRRQR